MTGANSYMGVMERLISLVSPHPCLYDTDHVSYKNIKLKEDIWNIIGSELNASGSWAKKEWRKLRDCHRDALKRRVGRDVEGAGFKKWKFEDRMDFLLPYMKSRNTTSDFVDFHPEQIESETDFSLLQKELAPSEMCDTQIPSPSSSSSEVAKRKNQMDKSEALDYFEQSAKVNAAWSKRIAVEKSHDLVRDPIDSFFEAMCATTKTLPKRYQLKIKRTLFNCVIQAEEDLLMTETVKDEESTNCIQ